MVHPTTEFPTSEVRVGGLLKETLTVGMCYNGDVVKRDDCFVRKTRLQLIPAVKRSFLSNDH